MTPNVGSVDRVSRILLGLGILAAGYHFHNAWGWLGLLPLLTGLIRVCPAYLPFGIRTCAGERSPRD